MHGSESPPALRVGQGKPRIVFLARADVKIDQLVSLLRQMMPAFTIELHHPFQRKDEIDRAVKLVLVNPVAESDITACLMEGRRRYPDASMGLLVNSGLSGSCFELMQSRLIKGIVPLDLDLAVLVGVLGILFAGGEYCPPHLVMHLPEALGGQMGAHQNERDYAAHGLTRREAEIMDFLSKGLQNKLIAAQMGLSEHTVKAHVRNLFTKLRVTNRTQAVAKCREWIGNSKHERVTGKALGKGAALHLFVG